MSEATTTLVTPPVAPVKRYPDFDVVDSLKDTALVADGFGDANGNPVWADFIKGIEGAVLALPNSTARNINPLGSMGNLVKATLPSLKVSGPWNLEEEECFRQIKDFVSRTTAIGVKNRVQRALAAEGLGRVMCRGKIPMKSGDPAVGVWISADPKPGGHIVGQFEKLAKRWANGRTSVLDWGEMAYERQPGAAKHLITALEGEQKEIGAAIAAFKAKALAVSSAAATNGNTAAPAETDESAADDSE
jgi:hypothetical protein